MANNIIIRIVETVLSDRSKVYAVALTDHAPRPPVGMTFDCVTERDALQLAQQMSAAIQATTNRDVVYPADYVTLQG